MSQNNNLGTTGKIVLVFSIFMISLFFAITDIGNKNTILDDKSIGLMGNLSVDYRANNYTNSLSLSTVNLTNDSSTLGIDPFYRQTAEDKIEVNNIKNTLVKVYKFPALFLLMFGVSNNAILIAFSGLVYSFLIFMISLQVYKAIRTGEVD